MKPEPTEDQVDLFYWMTIRLMAAKYIYYVTPETGSFMSDTHYDREERDWYNFGRELGLLEEDETSPCLDFDFEHPMAADAKLLAEYYSSHCRKHVKEVQELYKRYKQE